MAVVSSKNVGGGGDEVRGAKRTNYSKVWLVRFVNRLTTVPRVPARFLAPKNVI